MTKPMTIEAPEESPTDARRHVHEILSAMPDMMFLTWEATGDTPRVSARPLHVTKLDADDTMWFMVALDSKKVAQVRKHDDVVLTGQQGSRWIQLAGHAQIVSDRAKVTALFNKMHEAWFPDGPADTNVGLISFRPTSAEYWDTSGVAGMTYMFNVAKALLTGTEAESPKGTHGETSAM